jgi:septal ring factor EnvC (AmiA/AmiB activator)
MTALEVSDVSDKLERVEREIKRIKKLLKSVDKDRLATIGTLIKNAAFMSVTLDDLQDAMNQNGLISEYQNGANQWGTKKSPEIEIYNVMIKNHMAIMKQLVDLLPEKDANDKKDLLLEFLKK